MKFKPLSFILILLLLPIVEANYCDLNFNPQLFYYENLTLYTSFNMTKLNSTHYIFSFTENDTNTTKTYYLHIDCFQNKTFFLIYDKVYFETSPNRTVNISFIISPVLFRNYTIKSWGIFGNFTRTVNLSSPYIFNITYLFPIVPQGDYLQVYEISNGVEVGYISFTFHSIHYPKARIFKIDYPEVLTFGKKGKVSLLGENIDTARVDLFFGDTLINSFTLANTTENYFESYIFTTNSTVNKLKFVAENPYGAVEVEKTVATTKLDFGIKNLIIPALAIGQTSKILLVDFGVDEPIPIVINSSPYFGNDTKWFEYYLANDTGVINPEVAKQIYIYINPTKSNRGRIYVNISSTAFTPREMFVEFLGSVVTNPPNTNITYYGKSAECKIEGTDLLSSFYKCYFTLPYDVNIRDLQSYEIEMLKSGYDLRILSLERDIKDLEGYKTSLSVAVAILIIGLVIFIFKDHIKFIIWRIRK